MTALAEKVAVYSTEGAVVAEPTITHARLAMEDIGAFIPRSTAGEESWSTTEDLRGIQAFMDWCQGEANSEIRRIAGMTTKEGAKVEVGGLGDGEDFLSGTETALLHQSIADFNSSFEKKTGKAGDESRYHGTILASETEERAIKVEGGPVTDLNAWSKHVKEAGKLPFMEIHSSSVSALSSPPDDFNETWEGESPPALEES